MKRNKMVALMQIKRIKYSHQKVKQPYIINHSYSQWQESYYRKKEFLSQIVSTNKNIDQLIKAYQNNPSVYNLKMLEKLVHGNCEKINQCDQIINASQQYQSLEFMSPTMLAIQQNVSKHFRFLLFQQIKHLFQAKANVAEITSIAEQRQRSFNAFNNTQNISYASINSRSMFPQQNRQQSFQEVNSRIEGLNMILKRMNVMVHEQGQLINQIDQNMKKGTQNMAQGRKALQQRAQREQGTGQFQFSFQGRINQAITGLWGINVFLIIVWVFKNLI